MKLMAAVFVLACSSALAQSTSKPAATTKQLDGAVPPSGWILVLPATDSTSAGKQFQLPKDWMAAKQPNGVPLKGWPVVASVPKGAAHPLDEYLKDQELMAKQSAAIDYLSDRIDKLEARLKQLEGRGVQGK
jgi:hypothetical protein